MNIDPDSLDYSDHNLGDERETPEEKEIARLAERDRQWKTKYQQAMDSWVCDNVRNNEEIDMLRNRVEALNGDVKQFHENWSASERAREALRVELEGIVGGMPNPIGAREVVGIKCHHLPRLTIGSESGYICTECWALGAEKERDGLRAELELREAQATEYVKSGYAAADRINALIKVRAALVGLVGADGKEELAQLEVAIRLTPCPEEDRAATLNAIHALRDTTP